MKMNRFWALLLVLTMLLGMIPAVSAEGDVTEVSTSADFVTAMANGGNIKLTGSFTLSAKATVPAGKTVVLDLNGKTITSTAANNNFIEVASGGTLTVKDTAGDGGMTGSASKSASRCIRNYGTLTVEGGNFSVSNQHNAYAIYCEGATVTIKGGSFTGTTAATTANHAAGLGLKNSTATISGGTFTGNSSNTHTGSNVGAILATSENVTINISGGTFIGNRTNGSVVANAVASVLATLELNITGGNFSATGSNASLFKANTLSVTGGKFSEDISTLLPDGYTQNEDGSVSSNAATEVSTSADFVAAMANGGNIRLTGSFTLEAVAEVPEGKTVTLDLNGKTITSENGRSNYIHNLGTLTIKDSVGVGKITAMGKSSVSGTNSRTTCIMNDGDLTIVGGEISSKSESLMNYAIYSQTGNVTITGGTIAAQQNNSTNVVYALGLGGSGTVEISNATVQATSASNSTSARAAIVYLISNATPEIIIQSGDFAAAMGASSTTGASLIREKGTGNEGASLTINGGTFDIAVGTKGLIDSMTGTATITGGTFTTDVSAYLPEGYIQNEEGAVIEGVTTSQLVAKLISYYTNYQDAAAADIYRVLAQLKQLDPALGASWEKIMKFWSEANAEGFVNVGTVPQGLPNDNSLCIVILGYALNDDGTMQDELVDRLQTGLAIANAYPNAYVCVTGGGTAANNPDVTEAGLMAQWLKENGLSEDRLIIEDKAGSTVANAKNTYDVLVANYQSVDNIVMVTSDYHIVRGSLLYYTKFVLEAQATGGKQIGIIANCGYDTSKNYESVAAQAKSLCSLVGITYSNLPTVELTGQIREVKSSADFCTAMNAGGYIKLTGSFTLEAKATIPAGVTVILDLNGKTITSNDGSANYIHNQGALTITDSSSAVGGITADQNSNSSTANVQCINNDGVLTVEKGNFTASSVGGTAYAIFSKGSSVTITGGNFTANYNNKSGDYQAQTLGCGGTNATVTVGGDVKVTAESISEKTSSRCATVYTMSSSDNLQVTINGGTFTSTRTVGANGASTLRAAGDKVKVTINGGTFRATNAGSDYMFNTMKGELNIAGGTFYYDGQAFANKTVTITGGTFLTTGNGVLDVTECLASTHAQLDDGCVKEKTAVADVTMIGATAYKSLWEAVSKSVPGDIIVLQNDAAPVETIVIPEGVTLDLNGKTLDTIGMIGDVGQIVDSTQSGLLKVAKDRAIFNSYNQQLPVWDEAAGGYRMANVKIQVKTTSTVGVYYFRYDLTNAEWEKLLPGSDVTMLLRVEGYATPFQVPASMLERLYADETGRGAIKVTFNGMETALNVRVGVASRQVELGKFSGAEPTPVMTLAGPSGTVDTLASDVRTYLANAADKYDNATEAELETMTTAKSSNTQSMYTSMQAVDFNWTLENAELVLGGAKFYIHLSQDADFASYESIRCTRFAAGKQAQSEPVWNLMTGTTYYWRVVTTLADGTQVSSDVQSFTTAAGPRQIKIDGVSNARDLGGWTRAYDITLSDGTVLKAGTTVAQGFTYRSAKLEYATDAGKNTLINELGINFEIDLRSGTSSTLNEKAMPILENNFYRSSSAKQYADFINEPAVAGLYLKNFTKAENYPIIFHCNGGADRTGSLAFILGALQGVSEADLIKDYEFTSKRLVNGYTDGTFRDFPALLKAFHALEGDTPYEKARNFCLSAGLTNAEIDCIIQYMNGNLDYKP